MAGDLLGAALGGDVLCPYERRTPTLAGEIEKVVGYQRNRPSRTLLPWRVRGRVDNHLPDDSPARVMGVASGDEKSGQRLGYADRPWLGSVTIEMPQCGPHAPAVLNRRGELTRRPPRLTSGYFDPSTVLAGAIGPPSAGLESGKLNGWSRPAWATL